MFNLLLVNIVTFFLLIVFNDTTLSTFPQLRILHSLIEVFVTLVIPSLNFTFFFHLYIRQIRSIFELLAIAGIASLILPPFLLTFEYSFFNWLSHTLPLWNSFGAFILLICFFLLSKKYPTLSPKITSFPFRWHQIKSFLTDKTFIFSCIAFSVITLIFTFSFYALPDLDPYYWLEKYRSEFSKGSITLLFGYRPFFASLSYIFFISADVDSYAFFKYSLPFLPIILVLPITLLAQRFKRPLEQLLIFLSLFVNSVTLTYLELPIPQSLSIIFSLYAVYFLIYSYYSENELYHWLAGAILFFGYFYHEAMAIPFLLWGIISFFYYRHQILLLLKKHSISFPVIILLLIPYFHAPSLFVLYHLKRIFVSLTQLQPNWLFPSHYINIDGNQMGWGDFIGVTKYYLYYVGPEFFLLMVIFIFVFYKKTSQLKQIFQHVEMISALSISLTFFIIAEVLPRLFNVALLPERAWIMAGIFSLPLLFVLFRTTFPYKKILFLALILAFSANTFGAIYVNYTKKYMITEGQLVSANWIKNSLPQNRVIYTFENKRLLQFYSESKVISVKDPNFYYDKGVYTKELNGNQFLKEISIRDAEEKTFTIINQINKLKKNIQREKVEKTLTELEAQISSLEVTISNIEQAASQISSTKHIFIYYSAPDERNPYINRPYYTKFIGHEEKIFFDRYPDEFKRIYSDETNKIYIWQVL